MYPEKEVFHESNRLAAKLLITYFENIDLFQVSSHFGCESQIELN
jgi:hypothetical protein